MTSVSLFSLFNGLIIASSVLAMGRKRKKMQAICIRLRNTKQTMAAVNKVFDDYLIVVKEVSYTSSVIDNNVTCTKKYHLSCPRKTNIEEVLLKIGQLEDVDHIQLL